ncbi:MAG: HD domain-containing protein [Vallitaleaceae bacterium]|nr:HD domain-containing protein [Vallitaleaceae bacterium]
MRRINVSRLKTGMELAKPIYANNGVILLRDGTMLTQNYIEKIQYLQLPYIYIKDEISEGIEMDEMISDETRVETKRVLVNAILKMQKGNFHVNEEISSKVEEIITEVLSHPRIMVSLQEIRNKDEYLHMHSINVCVISLLIARKKGYNDTQMKHLALGALLHDIGKTRMENNKVLQYREELEEADFNEYTDHVRIGYEIIKSIPNSSLLAANIALTHHEKYDGTGFPLGKKNDSIHEFARIVAVANEYDNLVYNLSRKNTLRHYEVIEFMVSKAYSWFDPEIIRIFRSSISPYPIGAGVRLSDQRIGIVSRLNENLPTRPIVRIVNEQQVVIDEIDLSKNLNIMIEDEIDLDSSRENEKVIGE